MPILINIDFDKIVNKQNAMTSVPFLLLALIKIEPRFMLQFISDDKA